MKIRVSGRRKKGIPPFLKVVFFFGVLMFTFFFIASFFVAPHIQKLIETEGAKAIDGVIKMEKLTIRSFLPPTFTITDFRLYQPKTQTQISVERLNVQPFFTGIPIFDPENGLDIKIRAEKPKAQLRIVGEPPSTENQSSQASKQQNVGVLIDQLYGSLPFDIKLEMTISDGALYFYRYSSSGNLLETVFLEETDLKLKKKSFVRRSSPIQIDLDTKLTVIKDEFRFEYPLRVNTNSLSVDSQSVLLNTAQVVLGGVEVYLTGETKLHTKIAHEWLAKVNIDDLTRLDIPPKLLPKGRWKGAIYSEVKLIQQPGDVPNIRGYLRTNGLKGNLAIAQNDLVMQGPLDINVDVEFSYYKKLRVPRLEFSHNLSKVYIKYAHWVTKDKVTPFTSQFSASMDRDEIRIAKGDFTFGKITGNLQGSVNQSEGGLSNLVLNVKRTQLRGMEKLFPMLANNPLIGEVWMKALIRGDVFNPLKMYVEVNPVKIRNVQGRFKYADKVQQIFVGGPFKFNAQAVLVAQGKRLQKAEAVVGANLSGMTIGYKNLFKKSKGKNLSFAFKAKKSGQKINILTSQLITPAGWMEARGQIANPQEPRINMNIKLKKLDFLKLTRLVPKLGANKVAGVAQGQVQVNGVYNFAKGIEESPLAANGALSVSIPYFAIEKEKSAAVETKDILKPQPKTMEPMIPNWPITKKSKVNVALKLGKLKYDKEIFAGINSSAYFNGGQVSGKSTIASAFGGKINVKKFFADLLSNKPTYGVRSVITNMNLNKVALFLLPEEKDLASGSMSGSFSMSTLHPGLEGWMKTIEGSGNVNVKNAFLSSFKFDQMANQILSKLPGQGGVKKLDSKGVKGNMSSEFSIKQEKVNFKKLNLLTPENNQLYAQGLLGFDKQVDLTGKVYLANTNIKGCVMAGNSDKQGRLVIPVSFKGNVTEPKMGFAQKILEKMAKNALKCEADRQMKKIEDRAKQEVNKELDKGKKKLEKEVKKKLEGLFK